MQFTQRKVLEYQNPKQLEKVLNEGWTVMHAFGHKNGLVLVLGK